MNRRRSTIVLLVLVSALVAVDVILWRVADLVRYIGQSESVDAPVDKAVHDNFGPALKRSDLERQLAQAETPDAYNRIAGQLFKQLGDMGLTQDQCALMAQVVERNPDTYDSTTLAAYRFLLRFHQEQKHASDLQAVLTKLRRLALAPPANAKLLDEIHRAAAEAGLDRFDIETLEMISTLPEMRPTEKLGYLFELSLYYETYRADDRLRAVQARREPLLDRADLEAALTACRNRVEARIQRHEAPPAILAELDAAARFFPQAESSLRSTYWKLATQMAQEKVPDTSFLSVLWERLAAMPPLTQDRKRPRRWQWFDEIVWGKLPPQDPISQFWQQQADLQNFDALVAASSHAYLSAGQDALFLRLREIALNASPGWDMRPYLEAEHWARSGEQGPPPKPLYEIAFAPDAAIAIDGRLDEALYGRLKSIPGPWWIPGANQDPNSCRPAEGFAPQAMLFYTEHALHLAVRVADPHPERLTAAPGGAEEADPKKKRKRRGPQPLLQEEGIEFYLDADRSLGPYTAWTAALSGTCSVSLRAAGRHRGQAFEDGKAQKPPALAEGEAPTAEAEAAVCAAVVGAEGYALEMRIPLTQLPLADPAGRLVNANLRRILPGRKDLPEALRHAEFMIVSWTQSGISHSPHRFNFMRFAVPKAR